MTAYETIPSAVEAMRRGARAYLTKPFNPEELIFHIRTVEETLKLREMAFRFSRGEFVGASLYDKRSIRRSIWPQLPSLPY